VAATVYLADTTVYVLRARDDRVRRRVDELLIEGRLAACQMTALEFLNNAPDPQTYEQLYGAIVGHRWLDVTSSAMSRAMDVHRLLAGASQHRHFTLPDLIIAATAEEHGASVLHYDSDYDRIAAVTGQPCEWVVPPGSI
jgi:predicted nucleic acid-binding protein